MSRPLIGLREHLAPLLAALQPVAPVRMVWREAIGLVAAEDVIAPAAWPPAAVALRSGLAVNALDCVGASAQSPVPLPAMPARVAAGETLPMGCDAILDPDALHVGRFGAEALESVEPGAWVRLAGQDLAPGDPILAAGHRITPEHVLAAALTGIGNVAIRQPTVLLAWGDGPERDWLVQRLAKSGARVAGPGERADLVVRRATDDRPAIALAPGGAASTAWLEGTAHLALPPRFDGLFGGWCALALPILARLSGTGLASTSATLSAKIASAVGWTEVALLNVVEGQAHPLAVGDAPLDRILRANAFAIIGPDSEGAPAGTLIDVISLDRAF